MQKTILVLCENSDIDFLKAKFTELPQYKVILETDENITKKGLRNYLEETISAIRSGKLEVDGVTGLHDTVSMIAAIISEKTGIKGTSFQSILNCQQKYLSRAIQNKCIPEATPDFMLDEDFFSNDTKIPSPFVKPVRCNQSFASQIIHSVNELKQLMSESMDKLIKHNKSYLDCLEFAGLKPDELCNKFICEEVITGTQYYADGFIQNGNVNIIGYNKSLCLENSISFDRHEFPSSFSEKTYEMIEKTLDKLVKATGLDNTLFNVEFKYDEQKQKLSIIEINSRAALQSERVLELVCNFNMIEAACKLTLGEHVENKDTNGGKYKHCYSCELRTLEDQYIKAVPNEDNLKAIYQRFPGSKVVNKFVAGYLLSDYRQPVDSFRYAIVDVPGNSHEEVMANLSEIKSMLGYDFEDVEKYKARIA